MLTQRILKALPPSRTNAVTTRILRFVSPDLLVQYERENSSLTPRSRTPPIGCLIAMQLHIKHCGISFESRRFAVRSSRVSMVCMPFVDVGSGRLPLNAEVIRRVIDLEERNMSAERNNECPKRVNLLSCYFKARDEGGPERDVIMLCEMVGDEIQSISLRSAADPMTRYGRLNWAR